MLNFICLIPVVCTIAETNYALHATQTSQRGFGKGKWRECDSGRHVIRTCIVCVFVIVYSNVFVRCLGRFGLSSCYLKSLKRDQESLTGVKTCAARILPVLPEARVSHPFSPGIVWAACEMGTKQRMLTFLQLSGIITYLHIIFYHITFKWI